MVVAAAPRTVHSYWQAQGIAELALTHFEDAIQRDDSSAERRAFYTLASYYQRTRRIVRSALADHREPLAQAALRNLVVLHRPLMQMHGAAARTVPLAMVLEREDRDDIVRDLVVRALSESPEAMHAERILERVNELDVMGGVTAGTVRRHLKDLENSGHVIRVAEGHKRTSRTYSEVDVDAASLRALVGPNLYASLAGAGIRGLHDAEARANLLREQFAEADLCAETAAALLEAVTSLQDARLPSPSGWQHADLLNSPYPRPYQYEAYTVFRASGYQGDLVESPTGSGKTMIGMLCIQDFLRTLRSGQSILVLVPTSNYQQQWIGELCFNRIGLGVPPELVFSGTPGQLERFKRRTGSHPAIILMTYAALAQTGSGVGKGGFDVDSIELFLQMANIQYVVLDEVHKVVEDMRSVSADVTRQLTEWLRDGSIRGLIGFSGTAEAYRPRFAELGMRLAHSIPLDTLIGYGYVAPFAELGLPFANSARERRIRDLLDLYKAALLEYVGLLGAVRLRAYFAEIPLEERVAIGRSSFGMYRGRQDAADATAKRMREWERPGDIGLAEAAIVSIIQIARGWSDQDLAREAGMDATQFEGLLTRLSQMRTSLAELIYLPSTVRRLQLPGFGTTTGVQGENEWLATTIVGLYRGLSDWYLRAGEGRVETIKAVIDAERATRRISGTIVFDSGKRIRWRQGVTAPGYEGVAGLFAQLLGDKRFSVLAALSSEMYMTRDPENPLPARIAAFIETELMRGEVAGAIFRLVTQGLELRSEGASDLRETFDRLVADYVTGLAGARAQRPGEFRRKVLRPLQRAVRPHLSASAVTRFRSRLVAGNVHLTGLITTFFDYATLAADFRNAHVAEIEQVSGAQQSFYVVRMPGGRRKQLMYDLTARIVDADGLGVNLVIVSTWARTGWNVLKPNLLIDATATRDVTAWQQLRGRAMRALRTWTNDCYRLLLVLASESPDEDSAELTERVLGGILPLPDGLEALRQRALEDGVGSLSGEERQALRIGVILGRNKVTHIYELVKAFGSTRQVEYDRKLREWRRREAIERKHAYEHAVDIRSGAVARGVEHAPLVYQSDPRNDLPEALCASVGDTIRDRDPAIINGWLEASAAV
ncbi:MAG TPA: DEAD/DEAH box helicase [Chloroflexota bacterium]